MKIVTVQYEGTFDSLAEVFKKSVELNIPNAELINFDVKYPENESGRPMFCHHNHTKLEIWADFMQMASDNVIFSDLDMLALRDPVEIWDNNFDICYTERTIKNTGRIIPLNGGIIFAKPTTAAREFFKLWAEVDRMMYYDPKLHDQYYRKYAGMNQASLGYLIENPDLYSAKLLAVKTRKYNAVDCDWQHINNETVFVHIKSLLRQNIITRRNQSGIYKTAMQKWYEVEKLCRS